MKTFNLKLKDQEKTYKIVNIANIAKHYIQLNLKKGVSRKKNRGKARDF